MKTNVRKRQILGIWSVLLAVALTLLVLAGGAAASTTTEQAFADTNSNKTLIYFTNDVHGNFTNCQKENGMSYATLKALKDKGVSEGNNVYLIDAGDHCSGSAYANYDLGNSVLDLMNQTGYDFRVPGNHEFDYGSDAFFNRICKSAQYYACNFYKGNTTERGENLLPSYKLVDGKNGQKIAFIGVMTPETISCSAPGYFQDSEGNWVTYIDNATQPTQGAIYTQLNATVSEIKAQYPGAICIGVGHLGDEAAPKEAGIDSATVVSKSSGLSAFIDGHSHTIENMTINDADGKPVQLYQAAAGLEANAKNETAGMNRIGALTISADGTISGELLTATDGEYKAVTPDAQVKASEKNWINKVNASLQGQVSTNNIKFAPGSKAVQRAQDNNLANFVTDSMYYYANQYADSNGVVQQCDAAIFNGGGIRDTFTSGANTLNNYLKVCPFINKLAVAEVTGQQILDCLEYGAKDCPKTNGGFVHASGLTYSIDTTKPCKVQIQNGIWVSGPANPEEYRVVNVQIYDKSEGKFVNLDLTKTYRLCGTDYMICNSGDGNAMFHGCVKYANYNSLLHYQVLAQYAKDFKASANSALPEITSANSPLKNGATSVNFPINYEDENGSGRIQVMQ